MRKNEINEDLFIMIWEDFLDIIEDEDEEE